jgi:Clp amino terminal domain, pathogenicity island component
MEGVSAGSERGVLPDDIEALARRAAATPDALAALRAVTVLRSQLDGLERRHVVASVDAGASWAQIADALGVSKQAAHRRHAEAAREGQTGAHARERKVLVTSEARHAVRHAREEAAGLGHALVGTEHLLLGILCCERSAAFRALSSLGVELEAARACAQPTLVEEDDSGEARPEPESRRGMTAHAREVLERSLQEALARAEGYIGVEHLLLAVLRDEHGGAARTLAALGIERDAVRDALAAQW